MKLYVAIVALLASGAITALADGSLSEGNAFAASEGDYLNYNKDVAPECGAKYFNAECGAGDPAYHVPNVHDGDATISYETNKQAKLETLVTVGLKGTEHEMTFQHHVTGIWIKDEDGGKTLW